MPKNCMLEVRCPDCGEVRTVERLYRKVCSACSEIRNKERRLDTKRRPARRPYCDICVEDAKFEYYLKPDRAFRRTKSRGPEWCVLCELCFNTWLESGSHRAVHLSTRSPQHGAPSRPLMQDELDAIRASTRSAIDRNTGLFTYDWRRP
jgi:hypothetical protein